MATENLKIRVTSDSAQAKRDLGGFDDKLKSTLKSVVSITVALAAAKKAVDFFAQSTKMAMEQEKIFRSLRSAVEITGKSWGAASVELDNLFASLQRTTVYGDTESAAVFQKLLILTGDYEQSLKGLPLVLDMTASGMFDISSSARYVGMALTGNIEMLGRYFAEFKTANNEQLKGMDAAQKAAYAIDILKEKIGGLAEEELKTTAGQLKQLNNYWGDFREVIGDKVLPILNTLGRTIGETFGLFDEEFIGKTVEERTEIEMAKYKKVRDAFQQSYVDYKKNELAGLNATFSDILKMLDLAENLRTVGSELEFSFSYQTWEDDLKKTLEKMLQIPETISANIPVNLEFAEPTQEDIETIQEHLDRLYTAVPAMEITIDPEYLEEEIDKMSPFLNNFASTASSILQSGFKTGFDNIGDMFEDLINRMLADLVISGILQLITQGASSGFGFFAGLFGGHSGLEISNQGGYPVKGASGLDFTVPSGFPNDSFPILVESGEHVSVTPSGGSSRTDELLERVLEAINSKPVANTVLFDDVDMSRYVDRGKLKREYS